jgi:hypothetical protein
VFDLFHDEKAKKYPTRDLPIREEPVSGIFVEGLTEYLVQSETECVFLLKRGEKNRVVRGTYMNQNSSRSHSLFQLVLQTTKVDKNGFIRRSKLNLADLAGSEKINKQEEYRVNHVQELRNINLSLTTLGKVIYQLANAMNKGIDNAHIPFRESKLTRILTDSFGGGTKTLLIATVSPTSQSIEETMMTLKFADRAKNVMQKVTVN